jgi:crotonobetainyl-CoA:carnitine CoA-transferase CaiB-like acyl-CoA transferase
VPVGPVNTLEDVYADPFIVARGTLHHFVREDGVEIPSVAYPGKLSRTPAQFDRRPPRVGEHSRELLREWLDIDEAEFTALAQTGAVKG